MRFIALWTAVAALVSSPVFAQSPASWSALSGIEQFALRDVVRSKPPVDASPIRWTGSGPALTVARDRATADRLRRIQVTFTELRGFEYVTPSRSFPAASSDRARSVEGRYEYQRRMLTRRLPSAIEASAAIRASGAYLALTHHVDPGADIGLSTRTVGTALVVAATIARGRRVSADVRYGNGLLFGWMAPNGDGVSGSSGGGWTTDLDGGLSIRASRTLSVDTRYANLGRTFLATHRGFSTSGHRFIVGLRYAR